MGWDLENSGPEEGNDETGLFVSCLVSSVYNGEGALTGTGTRFLWHRIGTPLSCRGGCRGCCASGWTAWFSQAWFLLRSVDGIQLSGD